MAFSSCATASNFFLSCPLTPNAINSYFGLFYTIRDRLDLDCITPGFPPSSCGFGSIQLASWTLDACQTLLDISSETAANERYILALRIIIKQLHFRIPITRLCTTTIHNHIHPNQEHTCKTALLFRASSPIG